MNANMTNQTERPTANAPLTTREREELAAEVRELTGLFNRRSKSVEVSRLVYKRDHERQTKAFSERLAAIRAEERRVSEIARRIRLLKHELREGAASQNSTK